jgi:hypothetical protein
VHLNQMPGVELQMAALAIGAGMRQKTIWPETKK